MCWCISQLHHYATATPELDSWLTLGESSTYNANKPLASRSGEKQALDGKGYGYDPQRRYGQALATLGHPWLPPATLLGVIP